MISNKRLASKPNKKLAECVLEKLENAGPSGLTLLDVYQSRNKPPVEKYQSFAANFRRAIRYLKFTLKEEGKTVQWFPGTGKYYLIDNPVDGRPGERHTIIRLISTIETATVQAEAMVIATFDNEEKTDEYKAAKLLHRGLVRVLEDVREQLS